MDTALLQTAVATGGSVLVGITGMWITSNALGKRIEDLGKRLDDTNGNMKALEERIDKRLSVIEADLKEFFKDITRLKVHTKLDG
jgi:phosphopantetheine adenylyltransferase